MVDRIVLGDAASAAGRVGDAWNALRGARVFMTGGTGFVGTWMTATLLAASRERGLDVRLVLLTRSVDAFRRRAGAVADDPAVAFVEGEATTFEPPAGDFDVVVHAATEGGYGADRSRPLGTFDADLRATERVARLAAERGARRLLFTSSGAMYGVQPPDLPAIAETYAGAPDPTLERAAYGEGKRASEYAVCSYARTFGFGASIARLFAFSGPLLPLDLGFAIGNFVRDALAGGPIAVGGDGTAVRSYLYAADLAAWLWTIALRGADGRAYNTGAPEGITVADLARTVERLVAPGCGVTIAGLPRPGAAANRYVPDVTRARDELGLSAWTSLEAGILRMAEYARAIG